MESQLNEMNYDSITAESIDLQWDGPSQHLDQFVTAMEVSHEQVLAIRQPGEGHTQLPRGP